MFKISQLLAPTQTVELSGSIRNDMRNFIKAMAGETIDLKVWKMHGITVDQILDNLKQIYGLE